MMNIVNLKCKKKRCSVDCTCSICLELCGVNQTPTDSKKTKRKYKKCSQNPDCVNDNFILKKSESDLRQLNVIMDPSRIKKSQSYQEISKKLEANYQSNYRKNFEEYKKMYSTSNLLEEEPPGRQTGMKHAASSSKLTDHRTVIYFGDSFRKAEDEKPLLEVPKEQDLYHARRLCEELQFNRQNSVRRSKNFSALRRKAEAFAQSRVDQPPGVSIQGVTAEITTGSKPEPVEIKRKPEFVKQLKCVIENKVTKGPLVCNEVKVETPAPAQKLSKPGVSKQKPKPPSKQGVAEKINIPEPIFKRRAPDRPSNVIVNNCLEKDKSLPSYIESVVNGVINIRIEENFATASKIVAQVHEPSKKRIKDKKNNKSKNEVTVEGNGQMEFFDEDVIDDSCEQDEESYDDDEQENFDWSFVQEWRTRPSGNLQRGDLPNYKPQNQNGPNQISPGMHQIATSNPVAANNRITSPLIATPAKLTSNAKEAALRPVNPPDQQGKHNFSPIGQNGTKSPGNIPTPPKMPETKPGNVYIANSVSAANTRQSPAVPNGMTEAMTPQHGKVTPQKAVVGKVASVDMQLMRGLAKIQSTTPTRITVQSQPVKAQPAMISSGLDKINEEGQKGIKGEANVLDKDERSKESGKSSPNQNGLPTIQQPTSQKQLGGAITRTHHHNGAHDFSRLQRVQECHSSSDENRSSGHASMSDGHGSSSPGGNHRTTPLGPVPETERLAAGVTNRSTRSKASNGHPRARHRGTPAKIPWTGGGLEDVKAAIQQLTMRSQTSTSTYSSLSAGSESSVEPVRRLARYSSMETINTNVTSADEFVWVDSHNRLVELQHPPWSQHCVMRVIKSGRCREHAERISVEAIPRLGYLLQRALVRVAREIQRFSGGLGLCAKHEVASAFKIVLCPALADSCIKTCLRAAAMFQVPGDGAIKQSKSARAGLQLPVGRFHRWMVDARLGRFVHEYAAVYLCAGMENLLEEILLQCLPVDTSVPLTATGLEHAIAGSGDLWGLLQPYAHLNAGRIASGALTMPRWASQSSIGSGSGGSASHGNSPGLEPCLLTTCVGSLNELKDLVVRAQQRSQHITLSHGALRALFYFMRCSQLEHNEVGSSSSSSSNIQELCYERAYVVLPPLVEWLRVASSHAEYRHAILIDKDDIMQAARLLLPGVDCPPRPIVSEEDLPSKRQNIMLSHSSSNQGSLSSSCSSGSTSIEESSECGKRATTALAFKLMLSGRPELLIQALSLVPPTTRYDTINHQGLTALMIAALRNDESAIQTLLDAGADPNIEVPSAANQNYPAVHPETQHWTAATFAACRGNYTATRILIERGARIEGGARLSEDKCTITPLQAASGSLSVDIVSFLLSHGAQAFLSTQQKDTLCFAGTAQRGSYSSISVAAAHGQRSVLRKLLSHPLTPGKREVLSLEEMLAEGDNGRDRGNDSPTLNKTQIKSLQEAMYHSAENNHLDITLELRSLGVPWTLHCWMHALAAAHELRLDAVIDQLLQDFLQVCPDDYSQQFVMECLPLLFNIFRYSKKEGTTLILADIFSTCYGSEPIKPIKESGLQPPNGSRIDPKFVNNPELSDVTFRVEGRIFYGHKIVLVTAAPRLQNMLSSKINDGNSTPTIQINDIRYHIFELVMQFLYSGGCNALDVATEDVLELMAAASFFQLDKLLRYTESRCAEMVDIDNVVAMYIHAKVYNAIKLMEYCQGFLLQNMVTLLTYDDSVKRLMFAKKIPNHDVLNGLLATLQNRIKGRKYVGSTSAANTQHHRSPGANGAVNNNKKSK